MTDESILLLWRSMRKVRQPNTDLTRQQIVDAADRLIEQEGLNAASVSAVARSLGMSHANVYRHFKSKSELLAAVAIKWMGEMRSACEDMSHDTGCAADRLTDFVVRIRAELMRRERNHSALALYRYALHEMPSEAQAHHAHRSNLIARIVGSTEAVPAIVDALRVFTDPQVLAQDPSRIPKERIRAVCVLLCAGIEANQTKESDS